MQKNDHLSDVAHLHPTMLLPSPSCSSSSCASNSASTPYIALVMNKEKNIDETEIQKWKHKNDYETPTPNIHSFPTHQKNKSQGTASTSTLTIASNMSNTPLVPKRRKNRDVVITNKQKKKKLRRSERLQHSENICNDVITAKHCTMLSSSSSSAPLLLLHACSTGSNSNAIAYHQRPFITPSVSSLCSSNKHEVSTLTNSASRNSAPRNPVPINMTSYSSSYVSSNSMVSSKGSRKDTFKDHEHVETTREAPNQRVPTSNHNKDDYDDCANGDRFIADSDDDSMKYKNFSNIPTMSHDEGEIPDIEGQSHHKETLWSTVVNANGTVNINAYASSGKESKGMKENENENSQLVLGDDNEVNIKKTTKVTKKILSKHTTEMDTTSRLGCDAWKYQSNAFKAKNLPKHRYRLRSLSSVGSPFNSQTIVESNGNFVDLDQVSHALLKSNSLIHLYSFLLQPSNCSQYDCIDSHTYLLHYGSTYYQSLFKREEEQLRQSKQRLTKFHEESKVKQVDCDEESMNTENDAIESPTKKVNPRRIRTRSICRQEEEYRNKSHTIVHNTEEITSNMMMMIATTKNDQPMYIQVGIQKKIIADMRCTLVDWIIDVTKEFKLTNETLHCCVTIIDRSLEEIVVDDDTFHTLGCASLLIASKLVEKKHPRAVDIAYFTNGACSVTDICKMEIQITAALQFHLQFVTAFHFISRFICASHLRKSTCCHESEVLHLKEQDASNERDTSCAFCKFDINVKLEAMTLYFLDMSLLIPGIVDMKKSLVAAASLYIARAIVGVKDHVCFHKNNSRNQGGSTTNCIWNDAMVHYTGYDVADLSPVVSILHQYHHCVLNINDDVSRNREGGNCGKSVKRKRIAIFKKYTQKEYLEVAKKAAILSTDLLLW